VRSSDYLAYVLIGTMPFAGQGLSITPYFFPTDLGRRFTFALVLSVVAGLYPVWRASKLSPMTALGKE